jgi:lipoprotein-releasing system ATP-binding protein
MLPSNTQSHNPSSPIVMQCKHVHHYFGAGEQRLTILHDVNLCVNAGETLAIVGASGSGKSTLLQILAGLDRPSQGQVWWRDTDVTHCSDQQMTTLRQHMLGVVYQFHHLLPEFSAQDNVAMPLRIQGVTVEQAGRRAAEVLAQVGLAHRLHHLPAELSGGERQRVAIARAMVTQPACILADEPTGNLDPVTAQHVFDALMQVNQTYGTAIVMVTHDASLAQQMGSCYTMSALDLSSAAA